jgi:uncharacterized membrane protein YfcA
MQNLFLFCATLAAYLIKAITGFGNTLVMGSLFSFVVANRITTPIDLVFSIPTNMYMVWKERKSISLKVVIPLSIMLLMGIIPGTFLLKLGSDWILKTILGVVIVGLAIEMLTRKPDSGEVKKTNPLFLVSIGIVSGILAGMYGIGALLVAYISRTTNNRSAFRGNICCIFLVDNIFRFFMYLYTGILTKEVFMLALILSPAVIIGMLVGGKLDSHMKDETVRKTVITLLLVSGTTLFIKSLINH